MRLRACGFPAHGPRMFGQRVHQSADLLESLGQFLGCELFVRKSDFRHLRRVKNRMFDGFDGFYAGQRGTEFPAFEGGADDELPELFSRPDAMIYKRCNQLRKGANQGAQKGRHFWGY